jgi:hypothetical protein
VKRDWDLIRKQLTDIEERNTLFSEMPKLPQISSLTTEDYLVQIKLYREAEQLTFGHLDLLIKSGYIEGIKLKRAGDGSYYYGLTNPALTMSGHDLLDTIRSKGVWEKIKSTASEKGIELTFDAVKALGAFTLKNLLE